MAMEYLQNDGNTSSNGLVSIVMLVSGGVFFMVLQQSWFSEPSHISMGCLKLWFSFIP